MCNFMCNTTLYLCMYLKLKFALIRKQTCCWIFRCCRFSASCLHFYEAFFICLLWTNCEWTNDIRVHFVTEMAMNNMKNICYDCSKDVWQIFLPPFSIPSSRLRPCPFNRPLHKLCCSILLCLFRPPMLLHRRPIPIASVTCLLRCVLRPNGAR